jgi:hypothetical protein
MMHSSIGAPGFVRVGPAPECRAAVSSPQIHSRNLISLQIALSRVIQAPPPTVVFLSPEHP